MPKPSPRYLAVLSLALSACHGERAAPPVAVSCGTPSQARLATELEQGRPPETSPFGKCLANAAAQGEIHAAMLLADTYRDAIASPSAAALGLDLFGRSLGWLHIAADHGDPDAQLLLAEETDGPAAIAMPDSTLTWYQTAAENGNAAALAAIGSAWRHGRISDERLYDLRRWLAAQPRFAKKRL